MLLIWQGAGAFAFVIPFFVVLVAFVAADIVVGVSTAERWATLVIGIALVASAELLRRLTARLDRRPVRTLVDKETGEEVVLREHHTMFFVPLRYWVSLEAIVGVALIVLGLIQGIQGR
ncbi:MAG: hypothetical protein ACJ761_08535 [Chloroflexota bacterium]